MKKIGITGGKGGTGKSTVSVLLANKLLRKGKKVILCDCDVECPNDFLLLGEKLKKSAKKVFADFPILDKKKCQKCGLCVRTCRENAIFQKPGDYPTFIKDLCSGCGACWIVCPSKAIKTKKEEIGKIFLNKIKKDYWLVTGVAKPGLEETGPVVTETKKFALDFAKKVKADFANKISVSQRSNQRKSAYKPSQSEVYVLFDTAAGTHCPVISALLDCDLAYAVTEPTPMGAYDLNLILDLCQKLKVPAKIVLNQADLGNKKGIQKISKEFKIKIEREIPYSRKLVEAYSKGRLLDFKLNPVGQNYGYNSFFRKRPS